MNVPRLPKWFHHHGLKMSLGGEPLVTFVSNRKSVLIGNNAARLQIYSSGVKDEYVVFWRIHFFVDEYAEGRIKIPVGGIKDAFKLNSKHDVFHLDALAETMGADVGVAGQYIRKGSCLNIPMPGTGADGDPNISVFISKEIQEAVRELLEVRRK